MRPDEENVGVGVPTPGSADLDAEKDFERLGRQRPAVLPTWVTEAAFVFSIVGSMMMSEFFVSGFNIVLPSVATSMHMPDSLRTWPAAVINLTTACLLMPFSRLVDQHGGRSVCLGGLVWLIIWSVVSGFSRNPTMLIVCRALQGLGPGAYMPACLALLGRIYRPGPRKNFVFCLYGAFACFGFYLGILIGAATAQYLSWKWYFWVGAIMCALVFVAAYFSIPRSMGDVDPAARMDWWGFCTIVPGLTLVVFAFTDGGHAPQGWKTPYIYVTLILGVLFLAAAVYVQGWVSEQPLLPPELFTPKYMTRLCLALFCSYAWFTPLAVGGMFIAVGGGFLLHILPNRILMLISQGGFLISVLLFALVPSRDEETGSPSLSFIYWAYVFPAMLCGTIGIDTAYNITNVYITTAMPHRLQSAAGGVINSLLYLGMAFWLGVGELAVSSTILSQGEENVPITKQYRIGFWTGVALSGVGTLLISTVRMGKAKSGLTADEKAQLEEDRTAAAAAAAAAAELRGENVHHHT
ncbi:Major Facilitator Superfamily, partial [Geosmithia morbida]